MYRESMLTMDYKGKSMDKNILITGAAGFIGTHLIMKLLKEETFGLIVGIDNLNEYYDVNIKQYRLNRINEIAEKSKSEWVFKKCSLEEKEEIDDIFEKYHPQVVVNLAAQAGVRYSFENPEEYISSNIVGFFNILEACKTKISDSNHRLEHLIYASSSSVYGGNSKVPYSVDDKVDLPISLYAATKKADELLAHVYSKSFGIPATGLRFFTVYGPMGRPDMAYYKFTEKLLNNEKIQLFNYGKCKRDFTYIDDIVECIIRILECPPKENSVGAKYKVYNIGNSKPENLLDFVDVLQKELIKQGLLKSDFDFEEHTEFLPMQVGDVENTYADTRELEEDFGFKPRTNYKEGIAQFVSWYADYIR